MSNLYHQLQSANTEEDVKDAYIKALGLKGYSKGLIDIQTDEIWFEAKESPTPIASMFSQLLWYVRAARNNGEAIPPFLSVVDREKAAILETAKALPVFADKKIKWAKNASLQGVDKALINLISPYIEAHFTVFHIDHDEAEFIRTVKAAIAQGAIIRTPITPDNLRQVFDKWVEMIGRELDGVKEADYALLFFADIMFDPTLGKASEKDLTARLLMEGENPIFLLNGNTCELATVRGYRRFWSHYLRPPDRVHRNYLLSRRDSLLPIDERSFKGAFYTPLKVVDKAYDLLTETLGKNWQQQYIVWDPCCGVGNLEVKHNNHRNVFMSTLDKADVDVMQTNKHLFAESTRFQYDYLNDDINDKGEIDYSLTNKMPQELRQAIADAKAKKKGAKKILILMNPPYAEAGKGIAEGNKSGVAKSKFASLAMGKYGKARNELSTQFVARIYQEMPNAILGMFSKLKYINAPNFEEFRKNWQAEFLRGFVIHSKLFDGLSGNFPIGFLIWKTGKKEEITKIATLVYDKEFNCLGKKHFYNLPNDQFLSLWIKRPKANKHEVLPLKNAISPSTAQKTVTLTKWSENAIGYFFCDANDFQNATQSTVIFSSTYFKGHGFYITPENLSQSAVVFSMRRVVKQTWLNDRDQFLQPTGDLTDEFKNDCLIWMLFNGSNLTASANNLEWNEKKWSVVNHFIPFTEAEVGASGKFESDFMVRYLKGKKLSAEANAVLIAGKAIWQAYFSSEFERKIRDELKLNRPDVGWYQIRNALKMATAHGDINADFSKFESAYQNLSNKLHPQVYSLGFLKA